jgi:Flp pilus assembly protein TadD
MAIADEHSPPGLRNALMSALSRGDMGEAERLVLALLEHAPDAEAFNVLGVIELSRGRRALAGAHFARGLVLAPHAAPPALNLALIFHGEGSIRR